MKIDFSLRPQLPPLGWIATVDVSACTVFVRHGRLVEVAEHWYFEGAWAGSFEGGGFWNTECVFGTGGSVTGRAITFVTSTALCDSIYWSKLGTGQYVVANGLSLLLAVTGRRLDPHNSSYLEINQSLVRGFRLYKSNIPTTSAAVHRVAHQNLRLSDRNGVEILPKPASPHFRNYTDYRDFLTSSSGSLIANARDSLRKTPLQILSTQSKGYDSSAVNALLAKFGVDAAFTIAQAKQVGVAAGKERKPSESDDGTEICHALGISPILIARDAFRNLGDRELDFRAGFPECQDLNLAGILPHLEGPSLLFTGILGQIWYTDESLGSRGAEGDLAGWDQGGYGLGEARIRSGFTQVPLPFLGARRLSEIRSITRSPEMKPWRVGGNYDRPIPRRMAEEAGIPRSLFGQRKMATVVEDAFPELPFSGSLQRDYLEWLDGEGLCRTRVQGGLRLARTFNAITSRRHLKGYRYVYFFERAVSRLLRKEWFFRPVWTHLRSSLYVFAVNRLADDLEHGID